MRTEPKKKAIKPIRKGVAKVPVIIQMEALECGAACLDMVLAYYGKWVPLEKMRADCGVSRDGSRAINMLKAARGAGLKAAGYRCEPEELRKNGCFPCIIHWNFNHFVVLCGFRGSRACLNDPARGEYTVDMEAFDQSFTGVCLQFEPGPDFVPGGRKKSVLGFAKKRMQGMGAAVVFVAVTTLVTSLLEILNPAFSRVFLDRLLTGLNPEWFRPFIIGLSVLTLATVAVLAVEENYRYKLNGKLSVVANSTYLWHVLRLPMDFFSQRMAGDIAMRQQLNEGIANTLIQTVAPLMLNACMMLLYLVVMLRYSVVLTLVGVGAMVINVAMSRVISEKRVNVTRVQMRDEGKLASATVSGIEMIETIKSSGAENGFFEKWAGYQASVNRQQVRFAGVNYYLGMIPQLVTAVSTAGVLLIGVYLTLQGRFTAGMILAFQGFLMNFSSPAENLIAAGQTIQEMRTNMERVEDVMDYPTDVNYGERPAEGAKYQKLSGALVLKDVTFGYYRLGEPLIENFNLELKPGSRVAFVGASGCGKSTLSKLISGLYKPWSGEILFDGKSISEIDRSVFTSSVAVVDQDITLFADTIAANIKMWDATIEDFEMILAARDASLHEDIMERDGGYDYRLSEGGRDLSGGQRQRLEIARVLALDPTVVIMDEATSALDAKTEFEVVNAIRDRGITCIVIAHRLSTIRDCDEIIVFDHGKVIERGTHDELYQKGGLYTSLVSNE